jgi:hypothetical protein
MAAASGPAVAAAVNMVAAIAQNIMIMLLSS